MASSVLSVGTAESTNWRSNDAVTASSAAPGFADVRDRSSTDEDPADLLVLAAYLMTTDKRGVSALLLQRQLGLRRYETYWMMLHKLRRAMVNATREPLREEVEVDETWVGGEQAGHRGAYSSRTAGLPSS